MHVTVEKYSLRISRISWFSLIIKKGEDIKKEQLDRHDLAVLIAARLKAIHGLKPTDLPRVFRKSLEELYNNGSLKTAGNNKKCYVLTSKGKIILEACLEKLETSMVLQAVFHKTGRQEFYKIFYHILGELRLFHLKDNQPLQKILNQNLYEEKIKEFSS